jgi:hypothetical protein
MERKRDRHLRHSVAAVAYLSTRSHLILRPSRTLARLYFPLNPSVFSHSFKVHRERAMIEQKDVQLCSQGCCIYVNNQRLTKEEYDKGVARGEIGWHTQISCMSERGSKVIRATANKVGFYFGLPSPQQIGSKGWLGIRHQVPLLLTNRDSRRR